MSPCTVELTARCGAAPALLCALEELGIEYGLHVRSDGAFQAGDGVVGPALVLDGKRTVGLRASLERLAIVGPGGVSPRLLDRLFAQVAPAVRRFVAGAGADALGDALDALERDLDGYRVGAAVIDDAALTLLPRLAMLGLRLGPRWPGLARIAEALALRPSHARAVAAAGRAAQVAPVTPEELHADWFGAPATSAAEMDAKVLRWFVHASARDAELRERFGPTVDLAIAGELDHWARDARGAVTLIVALDQLPRQVFRGDARAFSGDVQARTMCVDALDRGLDRELSFEERAMLRMPLVHAEDPALQDRSVAEARRELERAPAALRDFAAVALEQAEKHRAWIAEFGRFPGRNAALGRISTAAEERFLVDFLDRAPPARYRPRP